MIKYKSLPFHKKGDKSKLVLSYYYDANSYNLLIEKITKKHAPIIEPGEDEATFLTAEEALKCAAVSGVYTDGHDHIDFFYVFWNAGRAKQDESDLVHECVHLTNFFLSAASITYTPEDDEIMAYTTDYFYSACKDSFFKGVLEPKYIKVK